MLDNLRVRSGVGGRTQLIGVPKMPDEIWRQQE
jgi:hypothetical protein